MKSSISLEIIPGCFAICRLDEKTNFSPDAPWTFWARTPDEVSLVCREDAVPSEAQKVEIGYAALRVRGVLDLSLVGILAQISHVMAEAQIPVFAISTFDTDYFLVPVGKMSQAVAACIEAGICVETTHCGDVP